MSVLDHALHAAFNTTKEAATDWGDEAERLAGKITIAQAGTLRVPTTCRCPATLSEDLVRAVG